MPSRRDQIAQLLMGQMLQQDQAPVSREETMRAPSRSDAWRQLDARSFPPDGDMQPGMPLGRAYPQGEPEGRAPTDMDILRGLPQGVPPPNYPSDDVLRRLPQGGQPQWSPLDYPEE